MIGEYWLEEKFLTKLFFTVSPPNWVHHPLLKYIVEVMNSW